VLPWVLAGLLLVGLGVSVYAQIDMAVSLGHRSRQLELVKAQRNALKLLNDSHTSAFTRDTIAGAIERHPDRSSFSRGEGVLVVDQVGLRFEGTHLKHVDVE
jgi:hypothetical protein